MGGPTLSWQMLLLTFRVSRLLLRSRRAMRRAIRLDREAEAAWTKAQAAVDRARTMAALVRHRQIRNLVADQHHRVGIGRMDRR